MRQRISIIAIVGAFIMAFSCTIKITAFHLGYPLVAQWVNVVMNALIVMGCFYLGRIVRLPRAHSLLCSTAILGYVFYGIVLVMLPSSTDVKLTDEVVFFFVLTLIMSAWFVVSLIHNGIKKHKEY